jgi:WD40 repeat protein
MSPYDAFISYSHKADSLTAPTLQKGLENLNRGWLRPRRLRIFRDETDLSLAPSLWGVIEEPLDSSRFFILLASPPAANSKWVDKEVRRWLDTKPASNILLVITDGGYEWDDTEHDFEHSASTAIPPALFGRFPEEPLFLDLRGVELRKYRRAEAQAAIASLAAPIHGKSKQELLGLEIQLFRRRLLIAGLALVSIALLAVGFFWNAVEASRQRDEASRQRDVARVERNQAQSQLAAARSTLELQNRQASSAFWHAVEAWRRDPNWVAQKALYDFARLGLHATLDHGARVSDAAISRDGRYAATSGVGGHKVWKTDGSLVFSASTGLDYGESADFAPDATSVAVGGPLRVFTIAGLKQFELPNEATEYARFSPDGRYIFTAGMGKPIRRLDRAGRPLNEYRYEGTASCVAPSADSSMVAAGTIQGNVYLWSSDGKVLRIFRQLGPVSSIEFSPDGSRLLSVTPKGVLFTNRADGVSRIILDREPLAAAILPKGDQVVVMGEKTIRLIDFDGRILRTLKDENESDSEADAEPSQPTPPTDSKAYRVIGRWGRGHISFASDGRYIVTSASGATRVWDLETGRIIKTLDGAISSASLSNNYVVTSDKYAGLVWDADNAFRSEVQQQPGISAVALAPADGALATASFDGKARVWDAQGNLAATLVHGAPLTSVAFSHDGQQLLTVGRDSTVRLWSQSGALLKEFRHDDIVNQAAFAPDDRHIVTASADGTAVIWTAQGDRVVALDHKSEVYYAAYSPDGRLLATGAADRTLRLWSPDLGLLRWQSATPGNVLKLAFSPDGRRIVATAGNEVMVFDPNTGRLLAELKHPDEVITAEVAPTRDLVVTSAADRIVRVWDMDGRLRAPGLSHTNSVSSLAVSRDGMRILTGSRDGSARLWDLSGNELMTFLDAENTQQVFFSVDGDTVITVSPHRVTAWNFGSAESIIAHYDQSIGKPSADEPTPDR